MRRLTERLHEGCYAVAECKKKCRYDNKYCIEAESECPAIAECLDKLGKLEDLEEAGRLVELPCKVGEFVWVAKQGEQTRRVLLDSASDILWEIEHGYAIGYTREEAEAALKGAE